MSCPSWLHFNSQTAYAVLPPVSCVASGSSKQVQSSTSLPITPLVSTSPYRRSVHGGYVLLPAYTASPALRMTGIPIGLLLTFSRLQWGLAGLWYGLTIALVYAAFFSCLIIKRAVSRHTLLFHICVLITISSSLFPPISQDWDVEVRKTLERMGVHSAKPNDAEENGAAAAAPAHRS
jgi:hypothetical protein